MSDVCEQHQKELKCFIETGEATKEFLAHLENCNECAQVVEETYRRQTKAFEELAKTLRQDTKGGAMSKAKDVLCKLGMIVGLILFACGFKMLMIPVGLTAGPAPAYAPYLFFIGFSLMGLSFLGFVTNLTAAPGKKDKTEN